MHNCQLPSRKIFSHVFVTGVSLLFSQKEKFLLFFDKFLLTFGFLSFILPL